MPRSHPFCGEKPGSAHAWNKLFEKKVFKKLRACSLVDCQFKRFRYETLNSKLETEFLALGVLFLKRRILNVWLLFKVSALIFYFDGDYFRLSTISSASFPVPIKVTGIPTSFSIISIKDFASLVSSEYFLTPATAGNLTSSFVSAI